MIQERLGLLQVAACLAVILTVFGLLARSERDGRVQELRSEGVALARLVSRVPYEEFENASGPQSPLQILASLGTPGFAYAVVVGADGSPVVEATAPGVIVPAAPPPPDPASWLDERDLEVAQGRVREFTAPILSQGRYVAHVRIGFFEPGFGVIAERAPLLATLALPIFLLAPLSYLLLRRVIRPFSRASGELHELAAVDRVQPLRIEASGEFAEFLAGFNRLLENAERRIREAELRQTGILASTKVLSYQKERIESVLESLPDATLVLDATGTVTFANAKFEGLMGRPAVEVVGRPLPEWCPDAELMAFLARYCDAGGRSQRTAQLAFSPRSGPERHVAVSAHPLLPGREGQEHPGTLVLCRDVTNEVIARRTQGEFVTHVAHELKSPLNTFATYTELLLGKDGESEDFRIEACNAIQDQVERLGSLIDTLMSIARIESGNVRLRRQRVRLAEFLGDALDAVSRGARSKGLGFELDLPRELTPVWVDKDLLGVAVNNLLTNAIKYNREGGKVTLGAQETSEGISIRVSDTGIGVTDEERGRIFDKFYRSERAEVQLRPGHGLGLALCREIVSLHGGEVRLESEPEEGSTFTIVFRKTGALVQEVREA